MNNDIEIRSVYKTEDFAKFKFMETNRTVDENHVINLSKELNRVGQINPIIVDENLYIIDGQHRYEALKLIKKPIEYMVSEYSGIEAVKSVNSTSRLWKLEDHVGQYALSGNENYEFIQEIYEEIKDTRNRIPLATLGKMAMGNVSVGTVGVAQEMKDGKLKVHNMDAFRNFIDDYKLVVNVLGFDTAFTRDISNPLFALMAYENFDLLYFQKRLDLDTNKQFIKKHLKNNDGHRVFGVLITMYNKNLEEADRLVMKETRDVDATGSPVLEHSPDLNKMNKELAVGK